MQQRTTTREEYLKRVNLVIEYINNHLGDDIDLNQLAEMSHLSPYHFHRVMSAFLGEPLGAFIVRKRIETAAHLLRYTDISVGDIAYRIGYGAPSSLSKAFRQFYSISPNEYRNNKEYTIMRPEKIWPDLQLEAEIREIPVRNVIYIRLTGDYRLNDYGGTCTDVCMVMPEPVLPKGEVGAKQIPTGRYASFIYKGSYEYLQAVYDTIYAKKLPEMGCTLRDEPSYERYLNDPRNTKPENLLTEICIPVQ